MPDEKSLFQTSGPSWAERAKLGGLQAVLTGQPRKRQHEFLHGLHGFGANKALQYFPPSSRIIDFGCGTGRFSIFFASRNRCVLGTEVTPEMIEQARIACTGSECEFVQTDGITLPCPSESIAGIWVCGVLRYSLFVPNPAYADIAKEMYRVLKPGGFVVNCEMYVDVAPYVFLEGFERCGFVTREISVLQRYGGRLERILAHHWIPESWLTRSAQLSAFARYTFDHPHRKVLGLRDYLFVWQKPL